MGHVFKSARYPPPFRERHCVNSISLTFTPEPEVLSNGPVDTPEPEVPSNGPVESTTTVE